MHSRLFTAVCVLFLLCAQFGALSHTLRHAGGHAYNHAAAFTQQLAQVPGAGANQNDTPAGQSELCAFDLAFGQVLGGVHATAAVAPVLALTDAPTAYHLNPRFSSEAPTAHSRGPPVLS